MSNVAQQPVVGPLGIPSRLLQQKSFGSKPSSPCSWPGTPSGVKSSTSPALSYNNAQTTPTHNWRPRTPSNSSQSKLSPILARTSSPLARAPSPALVSAKTGSCNGPGRQSPSGPPRATSTPVPSHRPRTPFSNNSRSSPKLLASQLTSADSMPALAEKARMPFTQSITPGRQSSPGVMFTSSSTPTMAELRTNMAHKKKRCFEGDVCSDNSNKKLIVSKQTNSRSNYSTPLKSLASVNGLLTHSSQKGSNSSLSNHCAASNGSSGRLEAGTRFTKSATTPDLQSRTPKVKTTAQLIQQLHDSGKLKLNRSETVTKIALNQIEKEADCHASVVPPEAKPRPRRKPGTAILPHVSDKSLSQTKTELVHKFLRTSITPTASEPDLNSLLKLDSPCSPESLHSGASVEPPAGIKWDIGSAGSDERKPTDDPWSLLPPLNLDGINWDEDEHIVIDRRPVCDADVDRLHSDHWSGVNGQYDSDQQWHDWRQTFSLPSYDGKLLHILPYVDIEYSDVDDNA